MNASRVCLTCDITWKKRKKKNHIVLSDDTDVSQLSHKHIAAMSFDTSWFRYPVVRRSVEYLGRWLTSLPRTRWTDGFRRFRSCHPTLFFLQHPTWWWGGAHNCRRTFQISRHKSYVRTSRSISIGFWIASSDSTTKVFVQNSSRVLKNHWALLLRSLMTC